MKSRIFFSATAALFAIVASGGDAAAAGEPLDLPPREVQALSVMPRIATRVPASDPTWLYRGAIRPDNAVEAAASKNGGEINRRQLELLRTLDKLHLFRPEDDLDFKHPDLGSIADKIGKPEVIPIAPRTVK